MGGRIELIVIMEGIEIEIRGMRSGGFKVNTYFFN
jgi:hypothetical protein